MRRRLPYFPGQTHLAWDLDDPASQDIEVVRSIRDEIGCRVRELVAELIPTQAHRPGNYPGAAFGGCQSG
jgi:hypothetical protein